MKFAINYSVAAADLLRRQQIQIDCFKCPAWPTLIPTVQATLATYVHFPLKVGAGIGDALDFETKQPADWAKVVALAEQTATPLINLHLSPTVQEHPDIPLNQVDHAISERLTECMIRDVNAVVQRFGKAQVIIENDYDERGGTLAAACQAEVIAQVVQETGCGFLLDLSHARLAARRLGTDIDAYLSTLPGNQLRELHITGIQYIDARWVDLLRRGGLTDDVIQRFAGRFQDHLPMTDADWTFFSWAIAQIRSGAWKTPWVVAFEYGGVGPLWEAMTEPDVLAEQTPRMYKMIKE